ncbi:helix-turn-helix domain-containing protein [Bacteroides fragilis]|jgi:transcriptional regulator with XRE-family HTH domain|uniref:XRE family transcriptional regulator n=1 Tax=Bacteroides fragilis TaxID=817 RepID=A0A412XWP2_BACFG|nr:helix-turn-helix transcriptional regulator [Bacteroides fragilis]RGV49576.1 XRE family transcriptional regulator [Bacteroides fragilis]RGV85938.1 XRE family transcriptional regulator [Bacteroides fragilis]
MERAINKRIKEIIRYLNISDTEFSKRISMPQSTISNIFNRDSDIKYSILESILTQFEFISSEWLLRGEGSMFRSNSKVDKTNYEKLLEEYTKQTEDLLSERDDEIRRLQLDNAILRAKEKVKNAG